MQIVITRYATINASALQEQFFISLMASAGNLLGLTGQNKKPAKEAGFLLSRQVSNLNSSDPESDVLPITPRDSFEDANIILTRKITNLNLILYSVI